MRQSTFQLEFLARPSINHTSSSRNLYANLKSAFRRFILWRSQYHKMRRILCCIPCALIVKEAVGALFEFLCDCLGLLVTLKPCLILLVESPALILQRFGSKILLICFLLVVKDIEQSIRIDPSVQSRIVKYRVDLLRIVRWCANGILWLVTPRRHYINGIRAAVQRGCQHPLRRLRWSTGDSSLGCFKRLE
jgi:hypothetical protein